MSCVCFVSLFFLFLGEKGVVAYSKLEQRSNKLNQRIQKKKASESIMREQLKALQTKDDYYEHIIKDKLLYIKKNETIIFFPPKE